MAALAQQVPSLLVVTASAFATPSTAPPAWSIERFALVTQEIVARWHASNLPSIQAAQEGDDVVEFEGLPLVATRTVRVQFRRIGKLPPMNLDDEVTVN